MKVKNPGLSYYVSRIESGYPFSFVRFGDGEWTAGILRDRNRTTSGSQALDIPELQKDMRRVFTNCHVARNYIPSLRPTSLKPEVETWLEGNVPKGVVWHDCRVFYLNSAHGKLFPFIDALQHLDIPIVLVGPVRLWTLRFSGLLPEAKLIVTPDVDCYVLKGQLIEQILNIKQPACIMFTAGPAAKVMIHQLYPVIGHHSYLLDLGSLWDVYVGHVTRKYHKTMTLETIEKNSLGL